MPKTSQSLALHYSSLNQTFLFYELSKPLHLEVTMVVMMTMMLAIMIMMTMVMISVLGKACQWSSRSTPDKGAP